MGQSTNILFDLIDIWAENNDFYSVQGTIKSVSEANRTCVVTPSDGGPDIPDVRLEADYSSTGTTSSKGFFLVPAVSSLVIVSFLDKDNAFISAWTIIDKVIAKQTTWIFNDGSNGGLIKISDQTDKVNDLISEIQAELTKIATGITGAGGAYTPGILTDLNESDFENSKITH